MRQVKFNFLDTFYKPKNIFLCNWSTLVVLPPYYKFPCLLCCTSKNIVTMTQNNFFLSFRLVWHVLISEESYEEKYSLFCNSEATCYGCRALDASTVLFWQWHKTNALLWSGKNETNEKCIMRYTEQSHEKTKPNLYCGQSCRKSRFP